MTKCDHHKNKGGECALETCPRMKSQARAKNLLLPYTFQQIKNHCFFKELEK